MRKGLKANGRLKKGYRYGKGGRVVKARAGGRRRSSTRRRRRTGGKSKLGRWIGFK